MIGVANFALGTAVVFCSVHTPTQEVLEIQHHKERRVFLKKAATELAKSTPSIPSRPFGYDQV